MKHKASPQFWTLHAALPEDVTASAQKAFDLLRNDPRHPSLHFKKLGGSNIWSARINDNFRAMAAEIPDGFLWFWIGSHDEYLRVIRRRF